MVGCRYEGGLRDGLRHYRGTFFSKEGKKVSATTSFVNL